MPAVVRRAVAAFDRLGASGARRHMDRPILREQTPAEYFKELVESALARQHVQAADLTEYYLVNLLCQYVRLDAGVNGAEHGEALALRLARALDSGGSEQRARLRSL